MMPVSKDSDLILLVKELEEAFLNQSKSHFIQWSLLPGKVLRIPLLPQHLWLYYRVKSAVIQENHNQFPNVLIST